MSAAPGRFITIEGIDGAGKTTHIRSIAALLEHHGLSCVVTREPGGTSLGEQLRSLLLHRDDIAICADVEALIVFSARAQHLHEVVRPALDAGKWVVCDRFTDATYAYQGGGRGLPMERLAQLEHWVQRGLRPDLTLLLDIPVERGRERTADTRGDRFETTSDAFLERVRQTYLARAAQEPDRIKVIEASRPLNEVAQLIEATIVRLIQQIDLAASHEPPSD